VLNNTKVLKARIKGRRKTGGAVEILLVRPLRDNVWECLLKPLRKIKIGEVLLLNGGAEVKLLERTERTAIIELGMSAQELDSYLDDWGEVPTPPYIRRKVKPGAVAAPTAGLHFTENLLQDLKNMGVKVPLNH